VNGLSVTATRAPGALPQGAADRRCVLVVGASRGIGAAIAAAFAATGDQVVLAARDRAALERVAGEIGRAAGAAPVVRTVDVTDEVAVRDLLGAVDDRFGRLDVAVNCAGGSLRGPARLGHWTAEEFRASIAVNLTGTFLALRHELELMSRTGGGAIVNVSSTAGQQPVAGLAGYVAGKHGLEGLTRVAALDNAAAGIRVNALAPGPVLTDALAAAGPEAQAATVAAVPLGRLGTPDEVAAAAVWLASPESGFVTGTTLTIDGGRLAGTPPFRPIPTQT
jgi:NAD(P)-dependent dehydrogenase (short-subunit alcohol dehydrogenase family)